MSFILSYLATFDFWIIFQCFYRDSGTLKGMSEVYANTIMIINDPVRDFDRIKSLVKQGYLVRTRADSGTQEARSNDTVRRNKAFQSGAQAISTDYFLSTNPFDSKYSVSIQAGIRCNPVLISENCSVLE